MILPIRDRRTFQALRSKGSRVRRGPLSAVFLADEIEVGPGGPGDPTATRLGFAVTKRVGTAVVRNRIRRRLRAIVAELAASQTGRIPPGALLISVGPEAVDRTPEELRNDVVRLLDAIESRRITGEGTR